MKCFLSTLKNIRPNFSFVLIYNYERQSKDVHIMLHKMQQICIVTCNIYLSYNAFSTLKPFIWFEAKTCLTHFLVKVKPRRGLNSYLPFFIDYWQIKFMVNISQELSFTIATQSSMKFWIWTKRENHLSMDCYLLTKSHW